jgi:hypothetical protein
MGADRPKRKQRGGSIDMAWEEETRRKIQGSGVVNRLISFINGEVKLEPAQVSASLGLLKKILPDLTSAEIKQETTVRYVARVPNKVETSIGWQQQHAPETKLIQ